MYIFCLRFFFYYFINFFIFVRILSKELIRVVCNFCPWLKQSYKNNKKLYKKQINNLIIIQRLFKFKYFQKNLSVQTDIIKYIFINYYLF